MDFQKNLTEMYGCKEQCRFVNDVLHIGKRGKDLLGRFPVEWSHREMIVGTLPDSQLFLEVLEGIELV